MKTKIKKLVNKYGWKRWIIGSVAIGVLMSVVMTGSEPAEAAWWNDSWGYRRLIQIDYSGGEYLTEYQVLIDGPDTATMITDGKMQPDCDDIRFTSLNGVILNYSIVGDTCNESTTKIWVQIDQIPADDADIYMYYGNPGAEPYQSEEKTFSYSEEKTVAYVLHNAVNDLQIMNFSPDNSITHNGVTRTMAQYTTSSFTSISQFGPITAKGYFNADDSSDDTDGIVPVSWAGKEFYVYSRNAAENFYIRAIAPWGNATVTVYDAGTAVTGCTGITILHTGSSYACSNVGQGTVRVSSSDNPILLFVQPTNSFDQMPVHPATDQKWLGSGLTPYVINGNASLDHRYYYDTAAAEQNPADIAANSFTTLTGGSSYGGGAMLVRSAAGGNIFGVQQIGDGDGSDGHYFNDETEQSTVFGSANGFDYISIASTSPFTCDITVQGIYIGASTATSSSSNTEIYHGGIGIGSSTQQTTSSWYMNCDAPVIAHYQKAAVAEANLMHYPMMRQYTYPEPAYNGIGAEEKSGAPIAYWSFDEGYGTAIHNSEEVYSEAGLSGWWKFDEGSGSTAYDEMAINDGTISNATYTTVYPHIGYSLYFNGTNACINVGDVVEYDGATELTISSWLRYDSTATDDSFVRKWNSGSQAFVMSFSGTPVDEIRMGINDSSGTNNLIVDSVGADLVASTWYQVTGVWRGGNDIDLYVNGQPVNTVITTDRSPSSIADVSEELGIGCRRDTSGGTPDLFYNGRIDDVRIYTRALTDGEVEATYNSLHGHMVNMDPASDWVDGALPTSDQAPMGQALDLDGTNDYVLVQDQPRLDFVDTDDFSISAWIKRNKTGVESILGKRAGPLAADAGYIVAINSSDLLLLEVSDGATEYIMRSDIAIDDTDWHHIVIVFDESSADDSEIYIDGMQHTGTTGGTIGNIGDISNSEQFTIGAESDGDLPFQGQIDEVKMFEHVLSSDEVKVEYNRGVAAAFAVGDDPDTAAGPIGEWKLDEGSGPTVFDTSGNERHGELGTGGSKPTWANGKYGNALYYDGVNDYVTFYNDLPNPTVFTVEAWIKGTFNAATFHHIYDDSNDLALSVYDGKLAAYCDPYGWWAPDVPIADDIWQHVAYTYDGTTQRLYVDGVERASVPTSGSWSYSTSGQWIGNAGSDFIGTIDDVKMYDYARNKTQLVQDMNAGHPAPGSPVGSAVASWKFDEGFGTTAYSGESAGEREKLVNWWKLDDAASGTCSGTVAEEMKTKNAATCVNTPIHTTGKIGNAMTFASASSEYLNVGQVDELKITDNLTLTAWAKRSSLGAVHEIMGNYVWGGTPATSGGYIFRFNSDNRLRADFGNGVVAQAVYGTGTVADTNWHHVAVSFSSGEVKFYIDGVLDSTQTSTVKYLANWLQPFRIASYSTGGNYFNGTLDDLRVYQRVLADGEIEALSKSQYGTMTNMDEATDWVDGKFGKALDFDGTDDYVEVMDSADISFGDGADDKPFSVSAWVNMDDATSFSILYKGSQSVTSDMEWYLGTQADDTIRLRLYDSIGGESIYTTTSATLTAYENSWIHLAATYDGSESNSGITIYLNGEEVSSTGGTAGTYVAMHDTAQPLTIGSFMPDNVTWRQFADGSIDEVNIYSSELSADQIKQVYNFGQAMVVGSVGTDSSGDASWSADRSYCVPGDTSTCNPPVAEWKMDERTGSIVYDNTTSGNSGQMVYMGEEDWVVGKHGRALQFDGTNDHVQVANDSSLEPTNTISFMTWVKVEGDGTHADGNYVIAKGQQGAVPYQSYRLTYYPSSNLYACKVAVGTTSYVAFSKSMFSPGSDWAHIACTYDGSYIRIYVNGKEENSTNVTGSIAYGLSVSNDLFIGAWNYPGWLRVFEGAIDDVRIYNYARGVEQIAWDYNQGEPIAHWKLDEAGGGIAHESQGTYNANDALAGFWPLDSLTETDYSGNGNTLTTSSTPTVTTGVRGNALDYASASSEYSYCTDASCGADLDYQGGGLTFSAWIKADSLLGAEYRGIMGKSYYTSATDNGGYGLYVGNGAGSDEIRFLLRNSSGTTVSSMLNSGVDISTTTWQHVVGTYDGSTSSLYVDGELKDSETYSGGVKNVSAVFDIGGSTGTWDGKIDHVKVWQRCLSAEEVKRETSYWETYGFLRNIETSSDWVFGKYQNGLDLDGVNEYVEILDTDLLTFVDAMNDTSFSMSAWINMDDATDFPIISKGSAGSLTAREWDLRTDDQDRLRFSLWELVTSDSIYRYTGALTDYENEWLHVGVTYGRLTYDINLFINGQEVSSTGASSGGLYSGMGDSNEPAWIGTYLPTHATLDEFANGIIDDVRVYNYELNADQMLTVYNEGSTVRFGPDQASEGPLVI